MDDVIVIGAGPAGATAAFELARRGVQVRMLERRRLPRRKLCAGGLPPKVIGTLGVPVADLVEQRCDRLRFRFAGRQPFDLGFERPVVHTVQRAALDERLARAAQAAGARLVRATVQALQAGPGPVRLETTSGELRARAVVAADGAGGCGARLLGPAGAKRWPAMQARVYPGRVSMDRWAGRLGCDFGCPVGGIGWVFPRRDHLAVGVCADRPGTDLRAALGRLLASEGLAGGRVEPARAHPVPVWDGRRVFRCGAVLVAGDAAGLANPLTGAGIRRAVLSGRLAAESIVAFLAGGGRDPEDLAAYDRRVKAELTGELARARLFARAFYRAPALFYRVGVLNMRINPWIEQLLAGQKDYRDVFSELVGLRWLGGARP